MPRTPDDVLLERYRSTRDAGALAELYDRTAVALLRVAMHLARRPAEAEDLVQATFLAAIESIDAYEPGRPALGWLVGILHHKAHALWKREARALDPVRLARPASVDPLDASLSDPRAARAEEWLAVGTSNARGARRGRIEDDGHRRAGRQHDVDRHEGAHGQSVIGGSDVDEVRTAPHAAHHDRTFAPAARPDLGRGGASRVVPGKDAHREVPNRPTAGDDRDLQFVPAAQHDAQVVPSPCERLVAAPHVVGVMLRVQPHPRAALVPPRHHEATQGIREHRPRSKQRVHGPDRGHRDGRAG